MILVTGDISIIEGTRDCSLACPCIYIKLAGFSSASRGLQWVMFGAGQVSHLLSCCSPPWAVSAVGYPVSPFTQGFLKK